DLETRFEAPLQDEKGECHMLTGIIDRIDNLEDDSWEVIDYKTAKKIPAQREIDSSLQLSIYLLGVKARWPNLKIPQIKLSLYFLKHGEKLTAAPDENRAESTRRKVLGLINNIQARLAKNDFPPVPSALCDWCGYRAICPMWKHKFNPELRIQEAELNQIIKEFFALKSQNDSNETRLAELKEMINDYCDKNGLERVFADDGSYITRSLQQRFSYDAARLKEILTPLGLWDEILTVDAPKLTRLIKTLPWPLQEEIKKTKILEKEFKVLKSGTKKNISNSEVRDNLTPA
ncbi:MAG: PD-(D/E)XK nuclease family protein, partial [bacterium]|nr:PD-(D/E)XK nuclease family protein [bacterium]